MKRRVYSIAYGAQRAYNFDVQADTILALDLLEAVQNGLELSAEAMPASEGYSNHKCYAQEVPDWAQKYGTL
jgi:hypothetical protein